MPKQFDIEPVLHEWVFHLKFQVQALLLTAIRGADGCNKHNAAKAIVRYLRGVVIKPAGNWKGKNDNDFMWGDYRVFNSFAADFWNDHDHYPHHFIMHLVHCAEVVGYKYPDSRIACFWKTFYFNACKSFHMNPETEQQMDERLNDFGIIAKTKKAYIPITGENIKYFL